MVVRRAGSGCSAYCLCDPGQVAQPFGGSFPQLQTGYHKISYFVGRVGQGDGGEVLGQPSLNSGPPMTFPHLSELSGWEPQGPPRSCLLPLRHLMPQRTSWGRTGDPEFPVPLRSLCTLPLGQDLGPLPLHHFLHLLRPGALCSHPVLLQGEAAIFLPKKCQPCEFSMEAGWEWGFHGPHLSPAHYRQPPFLLVLSIPMSSALLGLRAGRIKGSCSLRSGLRGFFPSCPLLF